MSSKHLRTVDSPPTCMHLSTYSHTLVDYLLRGQIQHAYRQSTTRLQVM